MKWKEIVDRCRLRRVPEGFGWVDHRFVRDGHVRGRSGGALALYLFLVTVADGDGVSYYSDETLCGHLGFNLYDLIPNKSQIDILNVISKWHNFNRLRRGFGRAVSPRPPRTPRRGVPTYFIKSI